MRVLFTTQPADGHLIPMLGLSATLRGRGHEVVFATSASYVPRVEARGERAVAAGVDWLESDGPIEQPDPETDPTGQVTRFARLFLREVGRRMADDLIDLVGDWRPHVIVRESVEFAGSAVAEREGIPFATFDFAFPHDLAFLTSTLGGGPHEGLVELRRHVGLDEASTPDWFAGGLRICTLPEAYLGRAHRRATEVAIRPNVLDVVDDAAVPGWVSELEDAVYVSLGTVFPKWFPDILELAVAGAAGFDAPTVVTHGPSIDAEALNLPRTGNVRLARYVPQGPVLDRCAAAVTHGGTGTVLGALARGVPVVVIPLGADQHAHADAVRRLGAGVVLDWSELTAERVTAAVRHVVADPSFAEAAWRVAEELAALPGPAVAAEALEQLAIGGR